MYVCMYVCMYICMYAGPFVFFRLRNQFSKHFNPRNLSTSLYHSYHWKRTREEMFLTMTDIMSLRCVCVCVRVCVHACVCV